MKHLVAPKVAKYQLINKIQSLKKNLSSNDTPCIDELIQFKKLLNCCIAGDKEALRVFQIVFGEDIYFYPRNLNKNNEEEAASFYFTALTNAEY